MLDATTKVLAAALASRGLATAVVVPTQNADFSLGLASAPFPIMVALAGLGILSFGSYMAFQAIRGNVPGWVPGMVIGGAVANLLDRLIFGAVHDWLYLPKVAVNLADIAVIGGMIGYFLTLLLPRKGPRSRPNAPPPVARREGSFVEDLKIWH
jgi:lipoprotein signal peptidase